MSARIEWRDLPAPKPGEGFGYYLHRVQLALGAANPLVVGAAAERFADARAWAEHNEPAAVETRRQQNKQSRWERLQSRRASCARRDVAFQRFLIVALTKPARRRKKVAK